MMPWGWAASRGTVDLGATAVGLVPGGEATIDWDEAEAARAEGTAGFAGAGGLVTLTAMRPGRMTRQGENILGVAAVRGARRGGISAGAAAARRVWMGA